MAHYKPAGSIIQGRIIGNDDRACRMIEVDAVIPGVNYKVIDDSSLRIRVIKSMNRRVTRALSRVDQANIVNNIFNHLVVRCGVVAVHDSSSAQVARCGSWTGNVVDMVSDVAHERSIVVQAYTPNRGHFKSHNVNVISVIVPGAV